MIKRYCDKCEEEIIGDVYYVTITTDSFDSLKSHKTKSGLRKKVLTMAEWWLCEEGGYICSKCGCYYDDYYIGLTPTKCSKCNSEMIVNNDMEVDRNYRLTKGINFVDESEYPEWLLKLRGADNG